jgi:hypothetical protein
MSPGRADSIQPTRALASEKEKNMSLKRILSALLIITAGFVLGCNDPGAVPGSLLSLLEGQGYDFLISGGTSIEGICVDSDSDGVIDGFDLDGDPAALEILVGQEVVDGVYEIDIDRDGIPDCYLTVDENGNITISTTADGAGTSVVLVMDTGRFSGIDTDGDGIADIFLQALNITVTVTTPGESTVTVSGDGTILGAFDQMTVTGGLAGASSWKWYLDGAIISGETSSSYTVDCFSLGLELGVHNITVIAVTASGSFSNQITFTVEN